MCRRAEIAGLLFASPFIIGFLAFGLIPIIASFFYSLTNFNLFQPPVFVGFENYVWLFTGRGSGEFYKCLINTLYMILSIPLSLAVALLTAQLLNIKVGGQSFYRTMFYLPSIVPPTASTMIWIWLLNPQSGLINGLLQNLGIVGPNWFMDPVWTKPALILIGCWMTGGAMIIFLASLQDVPKSLYESADIDGANAIAKFIKITLPSISPIIFFQLVMGIIGYFQYFTQAYMIANSVGGNAQNNVAMIGGPEKSILFFPVMIYSEAFSYFEMGKASAIAWVLLIFTAIVTLFVFKSSKRYVFYGGE